MIDPARAPRVGLIFLLVNFGFLWAGQAQTQDLSEQIELCTSCHGEEGLPVEADIPIIWGQEYYYLYVQLKDYKAGRRANEIMSGIVADLDKEQMKALAAHFAEKPWPAIGFVASETDIEAGQVAAVGGQCFVCHLGQYQGESRNPRLAGQQPGYLEKTMLDFKHDVRLNSPAKGTLLGGYEEAEIKAMANYLAGF